MRRGAGSRAGAVVSAGRLEPPRAARMRAVGTVGPDGVLVAVGIDPQPPRGRAVVEATIADLGPEYVVAGLRLEIAGFRVVTSERTVYGDAESGEDPE